MTDVALIDRPLVRVSALTKSYGPHRVLRGIDVDIHSGAVTAIVGPNGAGKTTLNKAILGLVRQNSGTIFFDGKDTAGEIAHRARIGYMPQTPRFPDNFTASDVLTLLSDLRGSARPRDESLVEAFALAPFIEQPIRVLSGGQRQRLNAAAAFLFTPDLLLLDEPTAGLDPVASGILKERIREVRAEGRAIVITSHILSELEQLADTVIFLHEGQVRWNGPLHELLHVAGAKTLEKAISSLMLSGSVMPAATAAATS